MNSPSNRNGVGNAPGPAQSADPVAALAAARAELAEWKTRWRILTESAMEWDFWLDTDGSFRYVSPACRALSGYAPESFLDDARLMERIVHSEDRPRFREWCADGCTRAGRPLEFRIITRHGQLRWIAQVCRRVSGDDGSAQGWRGVNRDITELKRAQHAQRLEAERAALYQGVVDASIDGFWIVDRNGRFLEVNDAYLRRSGYRREELLQMDVAALEARESPELVQSHIERVIREGSDLFETLHRAKDGTLWQAEINVVYWPRAGGRFFAFIRDIHRRNQSEALLRTRRELSDLALADDLPAVVRAALDAAQRFTGSAIGYFHLAGAEDGALDHYGWPAGTAYLCRCDGEARGCAEIDARLWGACSAQREPLVDNAYAARSEAEGGAGHGMSIGRLLSLPVVRDGRVAAALCVGDKATDYGADDVELVDQIASMVMDIVARLQAESALRASTSLYRELIDNMSAGVAVYEAVDDGGDFVFRDLNRAGERIGCTRREAVLARRVTEVYPGVGDLGLLDVLRQVWRDGRPRRHPMGLYRDRRLTLWVENYVFRLPGGEVVAVYDDTTERHRAEQALRESEADLKRAQVMGRIGSWRLDAECNEARCSEETYHIFGIAPATPLSHERFLAFTHPRDRARVDGDWQAALRGAPYDVEYRILVAEEVRWVRERAEFAFGDDGALRGGFGTIQDITDRKLAEETVLRKSEELQRMNAELEAFAYVASHDLRAPLRAVANLALVIDEDAGARLDTDNRRHLRTLRERVKGMDALIEGLLSYARTGRAARSVAPIALGPLLADIVAGVPVPAGFQVLWDDPLPTLVGDATELRQIFQNLLLNAMSHHDAPGRGHVWVRARGGDDVWCLDIADDGPGIPQALRERVFRMFTSAGKSGHTGIGLAVVRKLVVANGGAIEVVDNVPRGAVFRITWPAPR